MKDSDVKEVLLDHREALVAYQKIAEAQVKLNSSMLRRIKSLEVRTACTSVWALIMSAAIVVIAVKLLL